jgi:hypothetical protein
MIAIALTRRVAGVMEPNLGPWSYISFKFSMLLRGGVYGRKG